MPSTSVLIAVAPGPGLLFGLMLLAAIVGGYAARTIHVPRVIGFLVGGIALRLLLYGVLIPDDGGGQTAKLDAAAEPLKAIRDLALGLILFTIGRVFERSRLRAVGPQVCKISPVEICLTVFLVFVGCLAVTTVTQPMSGIQGNVVLSLLLAVAAIATAPAATLFVLDEYEAKGAITDTILGLTGVNNVSCIVLFSLTFLVVTSLGAIDTTGPLAEHLWFAVFMTTLGSVAFGVLCGTLLAIVHGKLPLRETLLVFFTLFIVLGAGEKWLLEHVGQSFNFLLTALVIGGVFANVAIDAEKLGEALRTVGAPIFAGFFVMAGYGLHIDDLGHMGWLGGAYVICRSVGKVVGCRIGVRWAGRPARARDSLGSALLCQAAVVVGLAAFVEHNWLSPLAKQFSTVVLGSVMVFELVGPLLVKRCVVLGGEVKAITLLRRARVAVEGASVGRVTLRSLVRLFGFHSKVHSHELRAMPVSHIMRTNVKLIPASAAFDEVLHFIERSTDNHFPVVHENGEFAGTIHFSDVREVVYDPTLRDLVTAVDLADPDSAIVSMDMTLGDLLDVFTAHNVGVLPVTESGDSPGANRVVGIVEQRDLLRALDLSQ